MSSSLGNIVQLTSFGESHGPSVGAVLQGVPSGISISYDQIQKALDERKPGNDEFSTPRKEEDKLQVLSGIYENKTTGTPIAVLIENGDKKSDDYDALRDKYRPGHADFSYDQKYKHRDHRGGGRSSIRVWAPIVAAGDICRQYLQSETKIDVNSFVYQIGTQYFYPLDLKKIRNWQKNAQKSILRFPDPTREEEILDYIKSVRQIEDTLGGAIHSSIRNLPSGLGEPIFEKIQSKLAYYLMNINTIKGIEFGDGFRAASALGSENNDYQQMKDGRIVLESNHSGGSLGGISTGEEIPINMAFKPISSIGKSQKILDRDGNTHEMRIGGRHDIFALPRAIPIVNAMIWLALADLFRQEKV